MRHGSLFAAVRGRDGRSLARALILLVLVNLFAAGLNLGASAATGDLVLCAADGRDGGPAPERPDHDPDCCLAGATPLGMSLAAKPPPAVPPPADRDILPRPEAEGGPPAAWTFRASARGPPLDA
jgi:hypothetical protein